MTISERDWRNYIRRLGRLDQRAGEEMEAYIARYGTEDREGLVAYANALVNKYGEGSAELAAQMYDEMAQEAGARVSPAEPAAVASPMEVAKAVYGNLGSPPNMKGAVSRMVKQAGADTTLKNALRDGAEFAWVPSGDTCPFCMTLASRGWQRASKKAIKGGHAEHIHASCDCTYAVRFDSKTTVAGYDPDRYLQMYEKAQGDSPGEKINAMRREQYRENREEINRQKREAYRARKDYTNTPKRAIIDYNKAVFAGKKDIAWHLNKHKADFDGWTEDQYLQRARNLLTETLDPGELEEVTRSDGSISRYCYSTNEFVATTSDGNIRTLFKPEHGREYWEDEHTRN